MGDTIRWLTSSSHFGQAAIAPHVVMVREGASSTFLLVRGAKRLDGAPANTMMRKVIAVANAKLRTAAG